MRRLSERVIGQDKAMRAIVPYIQMHQAGLSPEGRPIGIFLLLGPTGTGKTRTVEALAEVLHGSPKQVLKVDCGEFHLEHEVAKLIGAPPGYLGHRETHPILTQARLASVASRYSDISILLFDEVEKAAPSLTRLLLGVLDKATLRLGDNNTVNFERCVIFLTSNLGASGIMKTLERGFGFAAEQSVDSRRQNRALENVAMAAVRRHFAPEFVNRIDATLTYEPLDGPALSRILDLQLRELQWHVDRRLGERAFQIDVRPAGRKFLLLHGTSPQYGAREMKRTIHRHIMQPLAALIADGELEDTSTVRIDYSKRADSLTLKAA
jgi:ATP-dependent Clp protease ATP-binding subunit ClpB